MINRIAAGEVIHRPSHALKELFENSVDANSTQISITLKEGGLKLIQIQDNGKGISKEDLQLACLRFHTSKITTFEDLFKIQSYGFRGEALASISHVAHVTIISRTLDSVCAWKVEYQDGEPKSISQCAANYGTCIIVHDLFYNVPGRLECLKAHEEYQRCLDVIKKYALFNSGIAISLKKYGNPNDVCTQNTASIFDNLKQFYSKDCLFVEQNDKSKFEIYFSNPNYSAKKFEFILFVNSRLVENPSLKKKIQEVYQNVLPKNTHGFVYASLTIPPHNVDVNVHPTKNTVVFVDQDTCFEQMADIIAEKLESFNTRSFKVKSLVPQTPVRKETVRADARDRKLEEFFQPKTQDVVKEETRVELTSILELYRELCAEDDEETSVILQSHIFVGMIHCYAVIQCNANLYVLDFSELTKNLFYKSALEMFSNFPIITIPPASITELLETALDTYHDSKKHISREKIIEYTVSILDQMKEMLNEYFSIMIKNGCIVGLPRIVPGYTPNLGKLPEFVLSLGAEVEWEDEKTCLHLVLCKLSEFYMATEPSDSLEHCLFPILRKFVPRQSFRKDLYQIANLHELYKVFERC